MIPRYERWLAEAQVLLDGRPADEAAGVKARPSLADHEEKLAELVARSVPQTDDYRLAQARAHESYPKLKRIRAELTWLRRMMGLEEWPDRAEVERALEQAKLPEDAGQLLALARSLVGPAAKDLAQVSVGWVLAGRALEADAGENAVVYYPRALLTMAWAEARRGNKEAALVAMNQALDEQQVSGERRIGETSASAGEVESAALAALREEAGALEAFLSDCEDIVQVRGAARLKGLNAQATELEILVGERVFEDPEDGWWQRQLAALVRGIWELHNSETGLAGNTLAEPFGWGVAKRAGFASEVEERSVTGKDAVEKWEDAIAAIAVSEQYGGLTITPQLGLLPISPDPESGLWEFAHLQTGEPAMRGDDGRLIVVEATGLVFVLIPGGRFWMGAQSTDPGGRNYASQARAHEAPVHEVALSPYFLSKYEMTQGQWKRLASANPSSYGSHNWWSENYSRDHPEASLLHPVEQVTWTECASLLARLNLELPSEAQWEYACRAGMETKYSSGDELAPLAQVANIVDQYALKQGTSGWSGHEMVDDGNVVHARVGSYVANAFGLYDMHGNLWEWCRDGFVSDAYNQGAFVNEAYGVNR
ncbi:MAG: formylglycine-generating enzyme family protein, partial [Planctomycetota bacterium]